MKGSDYTRKTQELAGERKELSDVKNALVQEYQSITNNIAAELKQFEGTDWDQLKQDDPVAHAEQRTAFLELKQQQSSNQERQQKLASEQQEQYLAEMEQYVGTGRGSTTTHP